jgi:hypothetical protein
MNRTMLPLPPALVRAAVPVLAAAWLLLALRALTGFGARSEVVLNLQGGSVTAAGKAWKLPVPKEWRGPITAEHAEVFEDGVALHRRTGSRDVEEHGGGRFRTSGNSLTLAASDDSDPRGNGRRYVLRTAAPLSPVLLWGSLAALLLLARAGGYQLPERPRIPVRWWFPAMLLASLVLRGMVAWMRRDWSDPFMMVKGMPYSDCIGWLETARALLRGEGLVGEFAGQRPLYAVLLAGTALPGWDWMVAARLLNVVAGAAAAALAGAVMLRIAGRAAAVATVAMLSISPAQLGLLPLPMSEIPAMLAVIAGTGLLWRGSVSGKRADLFWGGVLHGVGCLICPFTLLAVPLMGIACACGDKRWTGFLQRGALVAAGASVILLPWIVRQKTVWGVGSISINSAMMLYATVSPSGRYGPDLETEALAAGLAPGDIRARAIYYGERFSAEVRRDPLRWLRLVNAGIARFHSRFDPRDPVLVLGLTGLGLWLALRLRDQLLMPRQAALLLLPMAGWCAQYLPPEWWLAAAAVGSLASGNRATRLWAVLLLCLIAGTAIMDGLTSGALGRRLWTMTEWCAACLAFLALQRLAAGLGRQSAHSDSGAVVDARVPGLSPTAAALCGFTLYASLLTGWRTLRGPEEFPVPTHGEAMAFLGKSLKSQPVTAHLSPDAARAWCGLLEIGEYRMTLGSREASGHWSRAFALRPDERTVVLAGQPGIPQLLALQIPGKEAAAWPRGWYLVAGVWNIDENAPLGHEVRMLEVIAASPWPGSHTPSPLPVSQTLRNILSVP